ncbi:MAG: hypothetical protein IID42_04465, partial [Planctomycetes bacterium]|nr:hypothetical protein [Planctomycetota bacterium]
MKQIIAGLLLASLPQWLPNALADVPKEDAVAIEAHVVQFTAGDGNTQAIQITGDGDGSGVAWVMVRADVDTDAGDGRSEGEITRRMVVKLSHDSDGEA